MTTTTCYITADDAHCVVYIILPNQRKRVELAVNAGMTVSQLCSMLFPDAVIELNVAPALPIAGMEDTFVLVSSPQP